MSDGGADVRSAGIPAGAHPSQRKSGNVGGGAVRITDRVRLAGQALTSGDPSATSRMNAALADDRTLVKHKDSGPPMDRQQGGRDSPDTPPPAKKPDDGGP